MCDITDLSDLWFEEMIGTDLADNLDDSVGLHHRKDGLHGGSGGGRRRSSASTLMMEDEVSYTHFTLISGDRICLKEEFKSEEDQDCQDNEESSCLTLKFLRIIILLNPLFGQSEYFLTIFLSFCQMPSRGRIQFQMLAFMIRL